jgi:putative ABC transport system permease protein
MIKNYLKIAWRNLNKNKGYSIINIGGLAIGIAACLLILQYVTFELGYEDFHTKKDRIYRVKQDRYDNGKLSTEWAAGAFAVGNNLAEAIPEIEDYVKVVETGDLIVKVKDEVLKIENVFFAGSSFFSIFSYPLIDGDINTVLMEPYTAAISETTALKVFGTRDAVGKSVLISGGHTYKITGVYKDMPSNTQLKPNFLASYASFVEQVKANSQGDEIQDPETWWTSDGCLTYFLLQEGADPKEVEAKFPPIVDQGIGEFMRRLNASVTYSLQKLTDIHLYSNYIMEPAPNGDGKTVYLLIGIAFFILLIAWINYINLATARAVGRAREVGVRKVVGSGRKQLMVQFFIESAIFNGLALILALLVVMAVIPAFNQISGQHLSYSLFGESGFWFGLIGLFAFGVFLSGLYPAFVLSSFKPVEVLKGKLVSTKQGTLFRKSLVVFQFAASLFLLIGSLVVYQQIQYMRNQPLGMDMDQTLVLRPPIVSDSTFVRKKEAFKQALLQYPNIKNVAVSSLVPGEGEGNNAGGIRLVEQDESQQKQYRFLRVDYDFIPLYNIKMIAGRAFSKDFGADRQAVIFNRTGITQLGFDKPEEAIGKQIEFWGDQCTIVGVAENFHQESLREAYDPLILRLDPNLNGYFSLKSGTDQLGRTMHQVRTEWDKFFPGNTYEYFFLDDNFDEQYRADRQFGTVFGIFTLLAILIACLGMFGLASYMTLQRTKEIGVRKVLGASVTEILKLLYEEFVVLLSLAFVLAIPFSWFIANNWLQGYAFRIGMHWTYFVLPFLLIVIIALITVSFQTIKAALVNPVKSLRTE